MASSLPCAVDAGGVAADPGPRDAPHVCDADRRSMVSSSRYCPLLLPLQSMLAMWRLILGHGKPRMFAMLAAQRAALAAAPRGPQTAIDSLQAASPAPQPGPSGASGGAAATQRGAPGPAAGSSTSAAPAAAGHGSRQPISRRLWLQTVAATAIGLRSPPATDSSAAVGSSAGGSSAGASGSRRGGNGSGRSGGGSGHGTGLARDSAGQADAVKRGPAPAQPPLQLHLQLRPPPGLLSSGDGIEMEHLIVGVLLGTPLLFLLPTTLVFHVFALLLAAGAAAVQVPASPCKYLCRSFCCWSDGAIIDPLPRLQLVHAYNVVQCLHRADRAADHQRCRLCGGVFCHIST